MGGASPCGRHPLFRLGSERFVKMKDTANEPALEVLKEQGFEIGESVIHDAHVRIRVRSRDASALVEIGQDLWDLAAGRLTLADVSRR